MRYAESRRPLAAARRLAVAILAYLAASLMPVAGLAQGDKDKKPTALLWHRGLEANDKEGIAAVTKYFTDAKDNTERKKDIEAQGARGLTPPTSPVPQAPRTMRRRAPGPRCLRLSRPRLPVASTTC